MRHLRCVSGLLTLALGMVVSCGTQEVERRSSQPRSPSVAIGNRVHEGARPRSTTTTHDLKRALEGVVAAVKTAEPYFPTTTTEAPPPTYRLIPPVRADNPLCPPPISERRCEQLSGLFDRIFGCASQWAQSVAARESGCSPTARHPEGASGLLQLMLPLHNDLFVAVGCNPVTQWFDAVCNLLAGKLLFDGSGTRPWRL